MSPTASDVYDFWFRETPAERWFRPDAGLDENIRSRFAQLWAKGRDGELASWEGTPEGALALIVLLDQFPRNMFRGHAEAFSSDAKAREITKRAIAKDFDLAVPEGHRFFFYLPLEHSESLPDQDESVRLTAERLGETHFTMVYAQNHHEVIRRFGRFPARNKALGRATTAEEAEFLKTHPAGF